MGRLRTDNSNSTLQRQLQPLIEERVTELVGLAKRGLPVHVQEQTLQELWLIQKAAPYWKPSDMNEVRTYLALTYNG